MKKEQNFLEGVSILMIAAVLAKIFGAAFKIPLASLLGGEGMGYYMTAYSVFGPVSAVALSGMTAAMSKTVAENRNNSELCRNLFKKILVIYGIFGGIVSFIIYLSADIISSYCKTAGGTIPIKCIAPAFFFCAVSAAARGYFEGLNNMYPTAFSQVSESFFRLILGSALAYTGARIFLNREIIAENRLVFTASMAVFGVTLSTMAGTLIIFIYYKIYRKKEQNISKFKAKTLPVKRVLMTAAPICLTAMVSNSASVIDLMTAANGIEKGFNLNPGYFMREFSYLGNEYLQGGKLGVYLFGAYTGMAVTLFNIIPTLATAFSTASIPLIAREHKKGNMYKTAEKAEHIIRYSLFTVIPMSVILSYNAKFILGIVFPLGKSETKAITEAMTVLALAAIPVAFVITLNSIEQALGRGYFSLKVMILTAVMKYIFNYIFIPYPQINIKGAGYSTLISYTVAAVLMLWDITKQTEGEFFIINSTVKILLLGIITAFIYKYILKSVNFGFNTMLWIIVSTLIYSVLYILIMVICGIISKKDINFSEFFKK